jgi:hypothetical protein
MSDAVQNIYDSLSNEFDGILYCIVILNTPEYANLAVIGSRMLGHYFSPLKDMSDAFEKRYDSQKKEFG